MSQRTFQFRLRSSHAAPDRAAASLALGRVCKAVGALTAGCCCCPCRHDRRSGSPCSGAWDVRKITVERAERIAATQSPARANMLRTILNNTESLSPWPSPSVLRTSSSLGAAWCSRTRRRDAARRSARSGKVANAVAAGTEAGPTDSAAAQLPLAGEGSASDQTTQRLRSKRSASITFTQALTKSHTKRGAPSLWA